MHAGQMSDERILEAIAADPRSAHILEAAYRDPATIERDPNVDPRHIDEARRRRDERDAFVATLPKRPSILPALLKALEEN